MSKKMKKKLKYFFKFLPDKLYVQLYYFAKFKKFVDFENPKTFNEKINWLKLYNINPKYTKMVDKYEAKEYVKNIIGEKYIIPTLGVWDSFDMIDFNKLPNQFILKCTHDSESFVICHNKKHFNIDEAKKIISEGMKYNFFYIGREYPYKNIKPRVIVEKYMKDSSTKELRDYKFFCFNGKVKFFKVDFDRFINHRANYYDTDLNLLDIGECAYPPDPNKEIDFPQNIKDMIPLAEKISKNFPFLRVDFYSINNKIYFGEITFFPASGFGKFTNEEWDLKLGSYIDLSNIERL